MSTRTKTRPKAAVRRSGGEATRRAQFQPLTFDAKARTVTAVIATETPVRRFFGTEILECTEAAIDMSRINGAQLLDTHNASSIISVLGRVENVRLEGRKLVATLHFGDDAEGRAALAKVAAGNVRDVSVGYSVLKDRETRGGDGQMQVTVTRWRPHEVSLTPVGADPNARIRSKERREMDPEDDIETIDETPPVEETRTRSRAPTIDQRTRRQIDDIRDQAIRAGIGEADIDEMLDGIRTVNGARSAVFDAMAERCARVPTSPAHSTGFSDGNSRGISRETFLAELAVRMGGSAPQGERPFVNMRSVELGRRFYEGEGVSTRSMDDSRVANMMLGREEVRAHTTSDFPTLLIDAQQRVLLERFSAYVTPMKGLSRKRMIRDFKPTSFVRPGEAPILERVAENGEIKFGTLETEEGGIAVTSFARAFQLTRQAFINDDLGAFADFNNTFAQSAASREAIEFFNLLAANSFAGATMKDETPLFHTSRNNKAASGAALSVETLTAARQAMRLHKNVNGTGLAGVTPAVLMVGPKLETLAEQLVAAISAATTSAVNPFAGKLRIEVENQYEGNGWWLFADPTTRPAFIHAYLDGFEGPRTRFEELFGRQGMTFCCELDFGCAPLDWRAAYFNPGVAE